MDVQAVCGADDNTIRQLGIATKGDLVALRVFCRRYTEKPHGEDRETKKKQLLSILTASGSSKKSVKKSKEKSSTDDNKKKRLELGWLHQSGDEDVYVNVRAKDGGGTRVVELPGNSRKMDIIAYGKKLFFPDGSSPLARADDLTFQLG